MPAETEKTSEGAPSIVCARGDTDKKPVIALNIIFSGITHLTRQPIKSSFPWPLTRIDLKCLVRRRWRVRFCRSDKSPGGTGHYQEFAVARCR